MAYRAFLFGANTFGLQFANSDIDLMVNALNTHEYNIVSHRLPFSKGTIMDALDSFCDDCASSDSIIVYFSGHGHLQRGHLSLLIGEDVAKLNKSSVSLRNVIDAIQNCKARNKLLILDCCSASAATSDWQYPQTEVQRLLAAGGRLEPAKEIDDLKSSFLTFMICRALTDTPKGVLNSRKCITVNRLYDWIGQQTRKYNADYGDSGSVPIPKLFGDQGGDYCLTGPVTRIRQYSGNSKGSLFQGYVNNVTSCFSGCSQACLGRYPWCRPPYEAVMAQTHYVMPRIKHSQDGKACRVQRLDAFFHEWLYDINTPHLALLGDSGVGKTSACMYLLNKLASNLGKDVPGNFIPIFVPLEIMGRVARLRNDIHSMLCELLDIRISQRALDQLVVKRQLVFILDGFDEISEQTNSGQIARNIMDLQPVLSTNCKTVLTCRTHYFVNQEQIDEIMRGKSAAGTDLYDLLLRGAPRFLISELQEFTKKQIQTAIKRRYPSKAKEVWQSIGKLYHLADLSKRPILLDLILRTLPELMGKTQDISRPDLYGAYAEYWLKRESQRKPLEIDLQMKARFVEHLAVQMWQLHTTALHHEQIADEIRREYREYIHSEPDVYVRDYDTRNASFLNRDEAGHYRFMHKSFMEYFVAVKCINEIAYEDQTMDTWKIKWFDKDVAQFLSEMLEGLAHQHRISPLARTCVTERDEILLWNVLHILSLLETNLFMSTVDKGILDSVVKRSRIESRAVLLRQYCRIIAKLVSEAEGKRLIGRVVEIVKGSRSENEDNNRTYINYYGGKKAAIEALFKHLESQSPKYDRELHIHVLGEIGAPLHARRLAKLARGWKDACSIDQAKGAIDKMDCLGSA